MSSDRSPKFIRISIATALTIGTVVTGLVGCYITLDTYLDRKSNRQYEREQQSQVNRVAALEAAGQHEECIREAAKVPQEAQVFWAAQTYWRNCHIHLAAARIEQAKQQAERGEFAQAIAEVSQIAVDSPSYSEAQHLTREWSECIWALAQSHYWQPVDQINQALTIAGAIPPHSPIYKEVQAQIQQWQQRWEDNQQQWVAAHQALSLGQFEQAMTAAQQIKDHPFWTPNRNVLIHKIQEQQLQRQYETILETARQLLRQGEPANAIATVAQLPDDYPWGERKQRLIDDAETKQRQVAVCRMFSLKLRSCY
ncbi:hypothetical protein [Leptolyngbya sp. FACHB-711]|uniref:hypothetical protein n=1 Tax=Leptolyngbya sp. FACHB-711 TaxID=2692813 RepID=UPI001682C5F8|nr:hypothetical protein [Leptolyngbya sp. FACHB-711]MBD2025664.1 hypothetical protein [Leptolyngbya sp. FACHB-711]